MTRHRLLEFKLRTEVFALLLDEEHICHEGFAKEVGVSRQYWSALFNRKRPVSPRVRRNILKNRRVRARGLREEQLWDRYELAGEASGGL